MLDPSIIWLPRTLYHQPNIPSLSFFHRSSSELPTATYARLPITAPPFSTIDPRSVRFSRMMTTQLTWATPDKKNYLAKALKVKSPFHSIFHQFQHRSRKGPPTRSPSRVFLFIFNLSYGCNLVSSHERESKVIVFDLFRKPQADTQHILDKCVEQLNYFYYSFVKSHISFLIVRAW
jgi:hypothetical protein